uniref:Uncharacterized protein n=1 Tax=Lotharella globosa TaxID=91324 RepID=A0A7S3YIL4_9EUKA|mmetsp:Transcript_18895/g.36249  ORF Transcript_18895/g.36249 Transcript_18895/m.36249 type:complete len:208 (+) Transcript_18895:595-1218(+)
MAWTKDPQVEVDGSMTSLFDTMEDINSSECLAKAKAIAKVDGEVTAVKNMAFVFVKPHANNEAVQKLVKDKFAESKISITKEGKIDGSVIDKKLLIDNHYYSIANKAKLTKPKDLAVPESGKKKFEEKFGLTWEAAIKANMVMNAAEAAKKYNVYDSESSLLTSFVSSTSLNIGKMLRWMQNPSMLVGPRPRIKEISSSLAAVRDPS